jgi:hypothetical protein
MNLVHAISDTVFEQSGNLSRLKGQPQSRLLIRTPQSNTPFHSVRVIDREESAHHAPLSRRGCQSRGAERYGRGALEVQRGEVIIAAYYFDLAARDTFLQIVQ